MDAGKVLNLFMKNGTNAPSEDKVVADMQNKIKKAETYLLPFHKQWFVSVASRRGLQYITSDSSGRVYTPEPSSDNTVRIISNKIDGIHGTRVAKIIKDMPRLEVLPADSSEEQKALARKGNQKLDWVWWNEDMPSKIVDVESWAVDCGNSFLFAYWNTDKGENISEFVEAEEGEPADEYGYKIDEMGDRVVIDGPPQGDVSIDVISPFDIINDGVSTTIQDSQWIIIRKAMPLEEIKTRWPERGKKVKAEKNTDDRTHYSQKMMSMVSSQSDYYSSDPQQTTDQAVVNWYYEKGTEKYPKGRMMIMAGGVLLETGDMPLNENSKKYPIFKFLDIKVSGSFWDLGTVEKTLPIQKGYNRTLSQIAENANYFGNIKLKAPKGHGMNAEAYDDTGTEIIEYNQGFEPQQMNPASLPSHVINMLDVYNKDFEDVSGMHEVSNARAPAGVKSGVAIDALAEQDDTRLSITKQSLFRNIEKLGAFVLELYAQEQLEPRTHRIRGNDQDIEEFTITPEEMQSMSKDVRLQTENIIAAHKRMKQEQVMEMWEGGLFGNKDDPMVRKKVLEMLEFGSVSQLFEENALDVGAARQENDKFKTGEDLEMIVDPMTGQQLPSLPVRDFEDHSIHINTVNQFRKSQSYRDLSPIRKQGVDLHAKTHEGYMNPQEANTSEPLPGATPPPGPMGPPPGVGAPPITGAPGMPASPPVEGGPVVAPGPMPPIAGKV